MPGARRGVILAVLAYAAWGFLSPVGSLLIQDTEPFTLNAIRTAVALPILFLVLGLRTTRQAFALALRSPSVWVLGGVWLTLTFVPYLWSLKFLPPTVATLTVYLSPLVVAAWQHGREREAVSPLAIPAVAATVVGGYLTIEGDATLAWDSATVAGLALALVGVAGWSGYTIQLKRLTRVHEANSLTLAAFLTSLVPFTVGGALEGFPFAWDGPGTGRLVLYVLVPTVLSFWLYTLGLRAASVTTVSVLLGVELVATVVVSSVLTNEAFTPLKIAGLLLTVAAMTAYLWHENRVQSRGVPAPAAR